MGGRGGRQRLDKVIGDILEPNSELGANFPAPGVAGRVRRARIKGNPFERGLGSLGDAGGRGESSVWLPFIPLNPRSSHQLLAGLPGFCPLPFLPCPPPHPPHPLSLLPTLSGVSPCGPGAEGLLWEMGTVSRQGPLSPGPWPEGCLLSVHTPIRPLSPSIPSPHLAPLSGPFPPPSLWNEKGDGREKKEFSLEEGG